MKMLHVSDGVAAVVAAQVRAGKSLQQIARLMGMSVEMVAVAAQKGSLIERKAHMN